MKIWDGAKRYDVRFHHANRETPFRNQRKQLDAHPQPEPQLHPKKVAVLDELRRQKRKARTTCVIGDMFQENPAEKPKFRERWRGDMTCSRLDNFDRKLGRLGAFLRAIEEVRHDDGEDLARQLLHSATMVGVIGFDDMLEALERGLHVPARRTLMPMITTQEIAQRRADKNEVIRLRQERRARRAEYSKKKAEKQAS